MSESRIADASPLILLSRAGHLELLRERQSEVLVPGAVAQEIRAYGEEDPTFVALRQTPWLRIVEVPEVPTPIIRWDLGSGESEVLSWALEHPECEAILDDLAARRCAKTLGIPHSGTLGAVLRAKRRGEIASARLVVEALQGAGMYLSDEVIAHALRLVGE